MSDLRIAFIAEGPRDRIVIHAALQAVLARPFILTPLQPEATRPQLGTGWCGVFKWCREFAARGATSLEADPTLPGFDLFVIHVDADVADTSYADGGEPMERLANGLPPLPCSKPCPPAKDAADEIRQRLIAWLGLSAVGPKPVLCVPSKAIEAWLAAAVLGETHALMDGLECNLNLKRHLQQLPRPQRISGTSDYLKHQSTVREGWATVRARCSQAERFSIEVGGASQDSKRKSDFR